MPSPPCGPLVWTQKFGPVLGTPVLVLCFCATFRADFVCLCWANALPNTARTAPARKANRVIRRCGSRNADERLNCFFICDYLELLDNNGSIQISGRAPARFCFLTELGCFRKHQSAYSGPCCPQRVGGCAQSSETILRLRRHPSHRTHPAWNFRASPCP